MGVSYYSLYDTTKKIIFIDVSVGLYRTSRPINELNSSKFALLEFFLVIPLLFQTETVHTYAHEYLLFYGRDRYLSNCVFEV